MQEETIFVHLFSYSVVKPVIHLTNMSAIGTTQYIGED